MGLMSQRGGGALVHIMYIRIYFLPFYHIVYVLLSLLFIVKLNGS